MKSQPSINHESKAGNSTGLRNYQNLLTLTLIPVSRSNNDLENAKTATLISSSTTTMQTNPKLSLVSNSNSDLVHPADINSDSTTIRNSMKVII